MKMITRPAMATLSIVFASTAYGFGGACIPLTGVVQTAPDGGCTIRAAQSAWSGSELPDPLLADVLPPSVPAASLCFTVKGFGTAQFSGSAGLTTVLAGNRTPQGEFVPRGPTPLTFESGVRAGLTNFTAQTVLTGKVFAGPKQLSGKLYTKDTGTITADGKVAEILKIVGGTKGFAGASGTIAIAGQELGGFAVYTGEICPGQ